MKYGLPCNRIGRWLKVIQSQPEKSLQKRAHHRDLQGLLGEWRRVWTSRTLAVKSKRFQVVCLSLSGSQM